MRVAISILSWSMPRIYLLHRRGQALNCGTYCHQPIAGLGATLENFSALGAWRTEQMLVLDKTPTIIDGVGATPKGEPLVGPRDLSHDLGVPGDTAASAFVEAIDQVKAASARHGKACGLLVNDGATAAQRLEQGWSFVGIGSDMTLLAAAVTTEFGRART